MSRSALHELDTFTFRCPRCGHNKAAVLKRIYRSGTISKAKMNTSNDDYELIYDDKPGTFEDLVTFNFACARCGEEVRDAKGNNITDKWSFARFCKLRGTIEEADNEKQEEKSMCEKELWGCLEFRVWDTVKKDYIGHDYYTEPTTPGKIQLPSMVQVRLADSWHNIESFNDWEYRFAVERCTGIKDHSDTWIYEGDIIERRNQLFVVAWHKDFAAFVLIPAEEMLRFMGRGNCPTFDLLSKAADEIDCSIGVDFSKCRVQGNIHTHRLLKEQQICGEDNGTEDEIRLSKSDLPHLIKALHTHINDETLLMHKTERDYRELNELCDLLHRLEEAHGGAFGNYKGN